MRILNLVSVFVAAALIRCGTTGDGQPSFGDSTPPPEVPVDGSTTPDAGTPPSNDAGDARDAGIDRIPDAGDPIDAGPGCVDDDHYEPNETSGAPTHLGWGGAATASLCPTGTDWFYYDVRALDEVSLTVSAQQNIDQIDAVLYDESGTRELARAQTTSPLFKVAQVSISSGTKLLLKVTTRAAERVDYRLIASKTGTCTGVVCNSPPANRCVGTDQLEVFETTGACYQAQCEYASSQQDCDFGCSGNACGAAPACTDDNKEGTGNDTRVTAVAAPTGTTSGLVLCPGSKDDFYSVTVNAGERLAVQLSFVHANGDIDLEIQDAQGGVKKSSYGSSDTESAALDATATGTYFIRVRFGGWGPPQQALTYAMTVTKGPAPPCPEDAANEPNDDYTAAKTIGTGTTSSLGVCDASEHDWWKIQVSSGERLTVRLDYDEAECWLNLDLTDSLGRSLSGQLSTSGTNYKEKAYDVAGPDTFRIKVEMSYDRGITPGCTYSLKVTRGAAPVCTDDANEPNDTTATAKTAPLGVTNNLALCLTSTKDYWKRSVTAGQKITVKIEFEHDEGDIEIKLYDGSGTEVDSSTSSTDSETVEFTATAVGSFSWKVFLYNDTDRGIQPGNTYKMTVTVQ